MSTPNLTPPNLTPKRRFSTRLSSIDDGVAMSPTLLRPNSRYQIPEGLAEDNGQGDNEYIRSQAMARFLYQRFNEQGWLKLQQKAISFEPLGVVMRVKRASQQETKFIAEPQSMSDDLATICTQLNVNVVFTMSSDITNLVFNKIKKDEQEITLPPRYTTIPVVDTLEDLAGPAGVRRRDLCCFARNPKLVVVWATSTHDILSQGANIENILMSAIWGESISDASLNSNMQKTLPSNTTIVSSNLHRTPGHGQSQQQRPRGTNGSYSTSSSLDASTAIQSTNASSLRKQKRSIAIVDSIDLGAEDEKRDLETLELPPRVFLLSHSVMVGIAMALLIVIECLPIRIIVEEVHALGPSAAPRLALCIVLPVMMFFTLFFVVVIIGIVFQLFGPLASVRSKNSNYYSCLAPDIRRHPNIEWPHITIQMPVYKEGLKGVIIPTINSLIPAIRDYERLGGTASIFVCEDGIQAVKPEVAEMRKQFYNANSIGWCARPKHGDNGYLRAGKFKKASNMNYCLNFSIRVEDELLRLMAEKAEKEGRVQASFSVSEEEEMYEKALQATIASDDGRTMAGGNIRMGEVILIIDCDTRVPKNCLSLGAMEMEESPEVAIIQHGSGVMQVLHSVFENAITYFTNLIYLLIKFSVGSGDCAPFVGHNAFLRWKALQSVSFIENDTLKFWSENHVSEDFDMSLRLQTAGFIVRLSTYDRGEFKEGVSLTALDELLRWEKYAFGCSELIMNPIHKWIYKGPFTALFKRFLRSNIKISAKFTILGYIGTYYAIGLGLPLTVLNYLLTGWFSDVLDHSYLSSFNLLCGTLFVFLLMSPIAFAWYRHRIGEKMFFHGLVEAFMWMPFFMVFFAGLSWHLAYALLAHIFTMPIEWSSTAKEVEDGGFLVSARKVFMFFKWVLLFMFILIGGTIYLAIWAPIGWRISAWTSIVPLALLIIGHCLFPVFCIIF